MEVVLVEPQIPPNTGNIARLCAATRCSLHLVGQLGFEISDRHLKRAGLDYWDFVEVSQHPDIETFLDALPQQRLFFFSKRGTSSYLKASFAENSILVFGSETKGLPRWIFDRYPEHIWRIPILHPQVRSLNLASAVSVVVYEALRQTKGSASGSTAASG